MLEGTQEIHHIVPRAKGGTNDPSNLIALTPREHFLAHWMLWRAYRDPETTSAFWMMSIMRKDRINSRTYQTLREHNAQRIREFNKLPETRELRRQAAMGNTHSKGKKMPKTAEHIENHRKSLAKYYASHTDSAETRWKKGSHRRCTWKITDEETGKSEIVEDRLQWARDKGMNASSFIATFSDRPLYKKRWRCEKV